MNLTFTEGNFIGEIHSLIEDVENNTTLEVTSEVAEYWVI